MKTRNDINVATEPIGVSVFPVPLQLIHDKVGVEIKVTGSDASTQVTLITSVTGKNFSPPDAEQCVIEIPAGTKIINVQFDGLTPKNFASLFFDKLTATQGIIELALG